MPAFIIVLAIEIAVMIAAVSFEHTNLCFSFLLLLFVFIFPFIVMCYFYNKAEERVVRQIRNRREVDCSDCCRWNNWMSDTYGCDIGSIEHRDEYRDWNEHIADSKTKNKDNNCVDFKRRFTSNPTM